MTTETSKTTNGSVTSNGAAVSGVHTNGIPTIELHLHVSDPDLYAELSKREEPERSKFAIAAMKIGIMLSAILLDKLMPNRFEKKANES